MACFHFASDLSGVLRSKVRLTYTHKQQIGIAQFVKCFDAINRQRVDRKVKDLISVSGVVWIS